ncbi:hypothetical protein [Myceligenerans crystallogenes]|uniref:Uncharacterized protein n=1 Tax=Myceligenerans crystallogenes TaxID=316335 RepID=A0ABP4ZAP4_9MICO
MSDTTVSENSASGSTTPEVTTPAPEGGKPARLGLRGYRKHAWTVMLWAILPLWILIGFYAPDYEYMAGIIGEMSMANPFIIFVLNTPAIAALVVLLSYDGWRGVANFGRSLVPRRKDLVWIPVLVAIMAAYIWVIRYLCILFGIEVPAEPLGPVDGLLKFLSLIVMEIGMLAIGAGFFGIFLPLMNRATGSRIWGGALTGLGIAVFVAPGMLLSGPEQAVAWPLYAVQLSVLGISMNLLLPVTKGNTWFFIIPFWVSASGSHLGLYEFKLDTQYIQIVLWAALTVVLYLVLKARGGGKLADELHTFPEYLENEYTTRQGAPFPGQGDRSKETAAVSGTPAAAEAGTA